MTNKELDKMCTNCEKGLAYKRIRCPFRSISNEYCEEYEKLENKLETLEILKPRIRLINCKVKNDNREYNVVFITAIGFVFENSKEHKLLKEWLENE